MKTPGFSVSLRLVMAVILFSALPSAVVLAQDVDSAIPSQDVDGAAPAQDVESTAPAAEADSATPAEDADSASPPEDVESATPVVDVDGSAQQEVDVELSELFIELRDDGKNAEQVITGLQENGVELTEATVYSVVNGGSIGLAIAYAQAGVCLAPDQAKAQLVGQAAVDNAIEEARKAVQSGVVTALSAYIKGQCQELLNQLNNASQAFAAPTASDDSGAPPVEEEEQPVSESE